MRLVQAFRVTNHNELAETVNRWLLENNAIAINLTVDFDAPYFHAFLIYETR